ncbi:SOS response-associated peptidase [Acidiphilium sp.]|uniref:SOS response-associated peptidase n=1 Tax=Acidiphilium sp. TaxID=527 RepID=UPI00258BC842|nr:SOS response-associated peptidase [Acidiphilium sp.]
MCGRFASTTPPETVARRFKTAGPAPNAAPSWNVAPNQPAMVVRRHPRTGESHLDLLTWGIIPRWTKDLAKARKPINARAETVATSPMFRDAFHRRRCIVPADAFYEWQAQESGPKQPYAIARRDGEMLAFAGIWEGWRGPAAEILRTFSIIVTAANEDLAPIHDRMPVILEQRDWPAWLGDQEADPAELLRPAEAGTVRIWPVSARVNKPANNDAALLEPIG